MMKRLLVLMTLIVLVQSFPLSVSADIIYEPQDDFLEQHCLECRNVDRKYVAYGPDGELTVYKSPENCMIQAEVPNRESIYISHVYTDDHGIEWGCVTLWDQGIIGWVPMPYVVPIYNGSDFRNEFADRLKEERGKVAVSVDQEIRFWEYPGSENYSTVTVGNPQNAPNYYCTFVDDAGRNWGQIGYYCGIRSEWVCLDQPSADYNTLYAIYPPQKVTKPEIQPVTEQATEPTTQPETEPTTQPETEPTMQPETEPTMQPETEPTTQPETEPTTQPETEPTTQPETELTTQPETEPATQPTTQPIVSDDIIKPSGISPTAILIAAAAVAAISAGLLVVLKKKKT